MNEPPRGPRLPGITISLLLLAGLGAVGAVVFVQGRQIDALVESVRAGDATLQEILGEVTRARLEQRAEALGPAGLLAKLRAYSPLLTSSRVPEPDYKAARAEMDAILRAIAAIGTDAWAPVTARLRELNGEQHFDEARWLVRAAVRIDPKAGKEIVKDIVAGTRLPSPRLRLDAARFLLEIDRPLAQNLLRGIMTTESSRGVNAERAMAAGAPIPDAAALSTSGFHNFVGLYVDSGDERIDETLLMVVGRAEHDVVTVQRCVEALGRRKCERAVATIEKLYREPPNGQENPLFLNHCLTALHEIRGTAARPFLEEALRTTSLPTVANHCRMLLGGDGSAAAQAANSIAPPGKK